MPKFDYIATTAAGKLKRGVIDSSSPDQVRKILGSKNLELVSCDEQRGAGQVLNKGVGEIFSMVFKRKISAMDKISFSHHLSVMLKAGVPIIDAVEVLGSDVKNFKFKNILSDLRSELEAGKTISTVLQREKFFSQSHLAMLKAGEASGNIEEVLTRVSNDLKRDYQITKKIKGAMAYPAIVLLALILVSGFIIVFVLPKVGEVFKQMQVSIPLPTRILLYLGDLLSQNLMFVLIGLLVFGAVTSFVIKTTNIGSKLLGKIVIVIPLVKNLINQINMARFIRSLSSLLESGVPIGQSIEISGEVFVSPKYQKIMIEAVEKIEQGVSLTTILKKHQSAFDSMFVKMVSVGEKSGKLSEILNEVALFYESEVDNKLENISTIIEPILMILVGFGVGGMVLSIIGPIYQMIGNMTR
jgi:type II secretory pathway component PulF